MLRRILDRRQEALLAEERRHLGDLRVALGDFGASAEDQAALEASIQQLDELFLLVVVGEFNAGKSAVINALLGERVLEEGVTPTTRRIQRIGYGESVAQEPGAVTAPLELLRELNIVDTPGTNAIQRQHEALTREFLPRSDLVLFVTSADRPFTESERSFLADIRDWGKKIVFVVNKVDLLERLDEVERVRTFVAEGARDLLGAAPPLFTVSARRALRAKLAAGEASGGTEAPPDPGFAALEAHVTATLDEGERVHLKLGNPLGVGLRLAGKALAAVDGRLDLLRQDVAALEEVETQLGTYREDMSREFRYRLADVDNLLHLFEQRGDEFFDETLRLGRIFDLLDRAKLKSAFEKQVVAEVPRQIEERVAGVIDWMVASDLRQWQGVMEHVERRRAAHAERIVGRVGGTFDVDRSRLLETVGRAARRAVESYDEEAEAGRMADGVRSALASTALVEVGAVGLGTLVTVLATSSFADWTGILAAGAVAVLGLFVIPARRRAAKRELRAKIADMRRQLMDTLTRQFDWELKRSEDRIREAIAPYTRFVRAERESLQARRQELARLRDALGEIRERLAA
jgi:small GTP-binding protein